MESLIVDELKLVENTLLDIDTSNSFHSEITTFLSNGSKRIRSKLALLYLKMYNIPVNKDVINILASGELIHNASLLQDDVIDHSMYRRGQQTIWKKFSPKISILASDYVIYLAVKKLLLLNNSEILTKFFECIKLMTEAEIKQSMFIGKIPSIEDYIFICNGKTGALFSAILESVSIVTNSDTYYAKKIGDIFGLLFQIKNDFSNESLHNDELNGIYTAKNILGIEKTKALIDNYKGDLLILLDAAPNNEYKRCLKDLIEEICLIEKK